MSNLHIPVNCDMPNCTNEATYWHDTAGTNYKTPLEGTFYLCDDCASYRSVNLNSEEIEVHLTSGETEKRELGVYACSDDCEDCHM